MTELHEALIVKDSAYTASGARQNTGLPANLANRLHYPVEAICSVCGEVVRREKPAPGRLDWAHTGRKPGEPQ